LTSLKWETRAAKISNESGQVFFEQNNIEFRPAGSQLAIKVVASKYFMVIKRDRQAGTFGKAACSSCMQGNS